MNTRNKGFLISFEGIDKSGKSTQIKKLEKYLKNSLKNVIVFGSLEGLKPVEMMREIILNKNIEKIDVITELLLYEAARREIVVKQIKPYLEKGYTIIVDRYIDSSLVYQGFLRDIPLTDIEYLNNLVTEKIMPDITFYLKINKETYINRIKDTNINDLDKIEIDSMYKYEILNDGYNYLSKLKERIIPIEEGEIDEVFNAIINHIQ
jgi:dTMP kinase